MSRADDLTAVLEDLGVDVHKQSGDEINGACPVHELLRGTTGTSTWTQACGNASRAGVGATCSTSLVF